jgi:hypothetical protein
MLNSIYRIICTDRFVANPIGATRVADEKLFQLWHAANVGMPMPATLISNSAERIKAFRDRCGGTIVYKTLRPMLWEALPATYRGVGTTLISESSILENCDLQSAPGIFQECIDKQAELRVTVLGRTVLAVEKTFPERTEKLSVDWRGMQKGVKYTAHKLPPEIEEKCFDLLGRLNLVMGCFDFAIDQHGKYYFLEVNPQGQFIWMDQVCPELNHLEAMCDFLVSKDRNFSYNQTNRIRLAEFSDRQIFKDFEDREREWHFGQVITFRYGLLSVPLVEGRPVPEDEIRESVLRELERHRLPEAEANAHSASVTK